MKVCSVCALELEDSYFFCPDDGSSLTATGGDGAPVRQVGTEPVDETNSVVFYCPACGVEYPLSFSACPVHGFPLTKQSMQCPQKQPASDSPETQINEKPVDLIRPRIESPPLVTRHKITPHSDPDLAIASGISAISTGLDFVEPLEGDTEFSAPAAAVRGTQYQPASLTEVHEPEQHGFRIAAIATMIALAIFALVGLFALVSNLSRRPSAAARAASQTEIVQPVPFVVTPQEALDYKEETPAGPSEKATGSHANELKAERERKEVLSSSIERRDRTTPVARPVAISHSPTVPSPAGATQASERPAPVLPRTNSGEFDSRLVRARASRTSSGYRYDLTFNMQEQRGHSAQWQRVLITTRSGSGTSHTQAIPFVHRLGATGALTFTISVELTGRSEADWRGRINCTTQGWDNTGAPLQANFVANVAP